MKERTSLPGDGLNELAQIMRRLRAPDGCPWDREQTFATIAPYTIEEAYEVADAVASGDMAALREELGDLALQVVYHAQMAAEAGAFTLADVLAGINAKMIRRHPHVFGDAAAVADAAAQAANWETMKAAERPRASALDGVASALPALMRAQKVAARAARAGFDWSDADAALAKVHEELAELAAAPDDAARREEAGDLLFAVAVHLRKLGVDAEAALRDATRKFERRFRAIESQPGFADAGLAGKVALWDAAKRNADIS